MFYQLKIAEVTRNLPLCPVNDELYIAAFVILGDPQLSAVSARELLKIAPEYDYIITAETKGIPLAHEMARQHGDERFFTIRKSPKLYMSGVFETTVNSITTEKQQKLYLDMADAKLMKGKRILIVDDVISTGDSLRAIEELVQKTDGIVVGKMAILAEGEATSRSDIAFLAELPLFSADGKILK